MKKETILKIIGVGIGIAFVIFGIYYVITA